jgi:hypothetical protein
VSGCDARLIVKKFHDKNANKVREDNESYLRGWVFRVTVDGQVFDIITDEFGAAMLAGLRGGQIVTIEERLDLQEDKNWLSTTGNPIQITLICGDNERHFGNVQGKPPKTGRGIRGPGGGIVPPGLASILSRLPWGAALAGLAIFLALVNTAVQRLVAQMEAGRTTLATRNQVFGCLWLPLVLLAVAIHSLTRGRRRRV